MVPSIEHISVQIWSVFLIFETLNGVGDPTPPTYNYASFVWCYLSNFVYFFAN